jgi:hypothetical protein
MSGITERDFGRLEAEVESLRNELREHKEESRRLMAEQGVKIDQLLSLANKGRGAWWAALTLASSAGAIVGFIADFFIRR